jgi:hypothetical protein
VRPAIPRRPSLMFVDEVPTPQIASSASGLRPDVTDSPKSYILNSLVTPEPPPSQQGLQAPDAPTTALSSIGPRSYWAARSHLSPQTPHSPQSSSSTASLPEVRTARRRRVRPLVRFSLSSQLLLHPRFQPNMRIGRRMMLPGPSRNIPRPPRRDPNGVAFPFWIGTPSARCGCGTGSPLMMPTSGPSSRDYVWTGEGPASPTTVFERTGDDVVECSAGVTPEVSLLPGVSGHVFLRGL